MGKFDGAQQLGIREKETGKLVAVYTGEITGDDRTKAKKALDWYYMKDCSTSEHIEDYFVDNLTERELKSVKSFKS